MAEGDKKSIVDQKLPGDEENNEKLAQDSQSEKAAETRDDESQKNEETDDQEKNQPTEAIVPVDVKAAGSADAALQQFMASESLAAATSAALAPPVPTADPIWQQVDEVLKAPTCRKCLMPCSIENLVNKTKSEGRVNVVCKGCNSAQTMLSRHLGQWPVPAFTGMSQEHQIGFWKQCHEIIQRQGRLDYGSIRACLTISLAERQYEIAKAKFVSEYLPVSVWVTRGFKEEDVRKGPKEDHPFLGETFAVPLKVVSKEHVREKVEEMIATFEAQVRKKKNAPVTRVGNIDASGSGTAAPLGDADDSELLEIKWLDPKSPSKKRAAEEIEESTDSGNAPPPDAKKVRQMANELRRHNVQIGKLAQKGLDTLNPLLGILMKHQANAHILPAQLVDDLKAVNSDLADLISQCQDGLKTPAGDERLPDLPFDSKSLNSKTKTFKQVFSNVDRMMKLINKSGPKAK